MSCKWGEWLNAIQSIRLQIQWKPGKDVQPIERLAAIIPEPALKQGFLADLRVLSIVVSGISAMT